MTSKISSFRAQNRKRSLQKVQAAVQASLPLWPYVPVDSCTRGVRVGKDAVWSLWWLILCQLDWAVEYPDILSDIILIVSEGGGGGVSGCDWMGRMSRADCPPWCEWASSNQLKTWIEQNCWVKSLPDCIARMVFSSFQTCTEISVSSSWILSLPAFRLELTRSALLVLRPVNSEWNETWVCLSLQLADLNCVPDIGILKTMLIRSQVEMRNMLLETRGKAMPVIK